MGNRVEDLERQVAELQAAVNGLTEELVEMKERVRQLEDAEDVGVETGAQPSPGPVETTGDEAAANAGDDADAGDAADTGDDVLVPEQEASTPDAEAAKKAADGEESEDGESGDSDIIVA